MTASAAAERHRRPWCGCAFGLRVSGPEALETLTACPPEVDLRRVFWSRLADHARLVEDWPGIGVKRLVGSSEGAGTTMSIDIDARGAYRIDAPGYGTHVVSADGRRITSILPSGSSWDWQRLFVAQPLPLAATVLGLEPLHASGVTLDGQAIAISAPSGSGKSSIALHLVARGAALITDDVLVVEQTSSGLLAHPGARLFSAHAHELAAVPSMARARFGTVLEVGEKVYLQASLDTKPRPLTTLYRLVREPVAEAMRITEEPTADPRDLLAATFLGYVNSRERMIRHLEFASSLAQRVRVFLVQMPRDLSALQAATRLEKHARSELGAPATRRSDAV